MSLFSKEKVRVRFAPSPTGSLHLGGLRTALYNYLFAKHHKGDFILRIEDTDQTRFVPGALQNIIDTLALAGLTYDEGPLLSGDAVGDKGAHGPYLQSKRLALYREHTKKLVDAGNAYPCFCTADRLEHMRAEQTLAKKPPMYDGKCKTLTPEEITNLRAQKIPEVVRLNVPKEGSTTFTDLVHGEITFQNELIDDQVLMKSDGYPTYHLAVIVDDHLMNISHVIRGEEWLSSTPKHLLLYKYFGWQPPAYAHLPLLLKQGGGKLSKRDMSSSAADYLESGYLKEALLNFIALLGWHPPGDKEILSLDEMVSAFDFKNVGHAGAVFTTDKLDWLNGTYLRLLSPEDFTQAALPFIKKAGLIDDSFPIKRLQKMVVLEQGRIKKLSELPEAIEFMFRAPTPEPTLLVWKSQPPADAADRLSELVEFLGALGEDHWSETALEPRVKEFLASSSTPNGEALWPLRVALSGRAASPGPFALSEALGKTETITRINTAIKILRA